MKLSLKQIVEDFAQGLQEVDRTKPQGKSKSRTYRPGVGPLSEADAIERVLGYLKTNDKNSPYSDASPKKYPTKSQKCDLVIPQEWAIEFKLIRPFGDNGKEAEHWSENILHPYPGNTSSLGDALKLTNSGFHERKAIIVFGYEHTPPQIDLTVAVQAFEVVAREVVCIKLGERFSKEFGTLVHPVHQQGKVFGWELL